MLYNMKNKFYLMLVIFLSLTITICPQIKKNPKVFPIDQSSKDISLIKFKNEILNAIEKKDTNFIVSVLDTNILNSFGGNGGIQEFWDMWQIEDPNTSFWNELKKVFTMGGTFIDNNKNMFAMPYLFSIWPEDLDPFTYVAAINKNVELYESPSKKSKIIKKISYEILMLVDFEEENNNWKNVMTLDSVYGFIQKDFIRSPIDYRVVLQKEKDKWKIISFVAGD